MKVSLTETGDLDGSPAIDGAVVRCAPFRGLAGLAPYATWTALSVTFRPPDAL